MSSSVTSSVNIIADINLSNWFDWIPSWLLNYNSFEETENEDLESIGIVAGYNVLLAVLLWLYWTCECAGVAVGGGSFRGGFGGKMHSTCSIYTLA